MALFFVDFLMKYNVMLLSEFQNENKITIFWDARFSLFTVI